MGPSTPAKRSTRASTRIRKQSEISPPSTPPPKARGVATSTGRKPTRAAASASSTPTGRMPGRKVSPHEGRMQPSSPAQRGSGVLISSSPESTTSAWGRPSTSSRGREPASRSTRSKVEGSAASTPSSRRGKVYYTSDEEEEGNKDDEMDVDDDDADVSDDNSNRVGSQDGDSDGNEGGEGEAIETGARAKSGQVAGVKRGRGAAKAGHLTSASDDGGDGEVRNISPPPKSQHGGHTSVPTRKNVTGISKASRETKGPTGRGSVKDYDESSEGSDDQDVVGDDDEELVDDDDVEELDDPIGSQDEEDSDDERAFATDATPKAMTKRQKARMADGPREELMELPQESKRRVMTEEELTLKRSENARRRKFQTQKRIEQDQLDTINKLLKKQASKRSKKDDADNENADTGDKEIQPTEIRLVIKPEVTLLALPLPESPEDEAVEILPVRKFTGYPAPPPPCSVTDCGIQKKYTHPSKHFNACSLLHYRQLLASSGQ
ncbi:INO80 complex subunit B [Tieghemiomyces parasiticus]|uniref:INO80 complex subunit B n=1 Tax=Tieghemiomyces parasiticus TaxID=78921 RepID=A0A9W8AC05_9FUNG|nr:INO80 complex subunit B [Tieghemiomyces parasiticus]